MTPSEAKVVAQFKDLTDEQTHMIKQAKKSPGKYVEGVLLSEAMKPALLRFVPPSLALSLGQTDGKEIKARKKLMDKNGITRVQAAEMIGEQIKTSRRAYAAGVAA